MGADVVEGLATRALDAGYDGSTVVGCIELSIRPGSVVSIIGPNGSGKSTILRTLARLLPPSSGAVTLDGRELAAWDTAALARRLAVLPQTHRVPEDLSARELVEYGRFPHRRAPGNDAAKDRAAVDRALALTGVSALADRQVSRLSGGERQRVWLAMSLAQEPSVLLLDEPTTHLDIRYQFETLDLVRSLNRETGLTVLMVLHDLNHAARYSDRVIAVKDHRVAADGEPSAVIRPEIVADVFGVRGRLLGDAAYPYFVATGSL